IATSENPKLSNIRNVSPMATAPPGHRVRDRRGGLGLQEPVPEPHVRQDRPFALTATAVPFLARRWRRVIWVLPLTVGFARVFVGAHFPLDVAGRFALGWTA